MQDKTTSLIPFKMFGLQRTGTNLMVALMKRNFAVVSLERGSEWKHGHVKDIHRTWEGIPARFILCVKNPYAWLVSCYKYFVRACGADRTIAPQFKRDPSMSFEEFVLTPSYEFTNPVQRWNQMYNDWMTLLPPERTGVVRHEDQLQNQLQALEDVEKRLGACRLRSELEAIDQRVGIGARIRGPMNFSYYLDREYMIHFTPSLLENVNRQLDASLMSRFRYAQERWTLVEREIRGLTLTLRPCTCDAGEARAMSFDPYGFEQLKATVPQLKMVVDLDAGIGSFGLWIKRQWPDATLRNYASCSEDARMIRINSRRVSSCSVIVPIGDDTQPAHNNSTELVGPRLFLSKLISDCGGHIDLLKLSDQVLASLSVSMEIAGVLPRINRLCAKISSESTDNAAVFLALSNSHNVKTLRNRFGSYLLAERLQ